MAARNSGVKVRLRCSLAWLGGVAGGAAAERQLLESPFTQAGQLKAEAVALLTSPTLYTKAYHAIFPLEPPPMVREGAGDGGVNGTEERETFWPLIHALSRHGLYIVEEGEQAVNHSILAQSNPFRESSHLALLDVLMLAYASSAVSTAHVVRAVRRISTFNASRDLPSSVEQSLLLWLRKVSEAVTHTHQQEITSMVQESDARQRWRHRLQLLKHEQPAMAPVKDLWEAVEGGQSMAALLVHYCPQEFKWEDFHFSPHPLTQAEALSNLSKVATYCHAHLPPPSFHLKPKTLINKAKSSFLHTNILALMTCLFKFFESDKGRTGNSQLQETSPPLATSSLPRDARRHTGRNKLTPSSHQGQDTPTGSLLSSVARGNSDSSLRRSRKSEGRSSHKSVLPLRPKTPLTASHSASNLSVARGREVSAAAAGSAGGNPLSSSSSSPALAGHAHHSLRAHDTLAFHPPIISSSPGAPKMERGRGALTHASSSASAAVITASVDNLGIRERMERGKKKEREEERVREREGREKQMVRYPTGTEGSSLDSSGSSDDLSVMVTTDTIQTAMNKVEGMPLPFSSHQPQVSTCFTERGTATSGEVKRSFTLDKQHTIATASAAGLPIIGEHNMVEREREREREKEKRQWVRGKENEKEGSKEEMGEVIDGTRQPTAPSALSDKTKTIERSRERGSLIPKTPHIETQHGSPTLPSTAAPSTSEPRVLVVYGPLAEFREKRDYEEYIWRYVERAEQLVLERRSWRQQLQEKRRRREADVRKNITPPLSPIASWAPSIPSSPPPSPPPPPPSNLRNQSVTGQVSSQVVGHTPSGPVIPRPLQPHLMLNSTAARNHLPAGRMPLPNDPTTNCPLSPVTSTRGLNVDDTPNTHPPGEGAMATSGGTTNPWATGGIVWDLTPMTPNKDETSTAALQARRQQLLRQRLEERQKARKHAKTEERKRAAIKQSIRGLTLPYNASMETEGSTQSFRLSAQAPSQHTSTTSHTPSSHTHPSHPPPTRTSHPPPSRSHPPHPPPSRTHHPPTHPPPSSSSSSFLSHNGPECYVKPSAKSNRKLIRNALCHVCLAGEANLPTKQRALAELDACSALHFLILFKRVINFNFRALYTFSPEEGKVTKIFGSGPKSVKEEMVAQLFKYNSGSKEFLHIHTHSFSLSVDAFTLKPEVWASRKSKQPPM